VLASIMALSGADMLRKSFQVVKKLPK